MQQIEISTKLSKLVPNLQLSCIECDVQTDERNEQLWNKIEEKIESLNQSLKIEDIRRIPAIAASRKAYKICGKDPARYRVSAEALLRRVLKRKELYPINNVVDCLNLVSISLGFSIGGYDASKITGKAVFGIGKKDEPYTGIGRGELNIEGMPVFRDAQGAFGTPTSDSVRTSVTPQTQRFLMIIIDYGNSGKLTTATTQAESLLKEYASATKFEFNTVKNDETIC